MSNYTVSGNRSKGYSVTKDNSSRASRANIGTQGQAEQLAKQYSKSTGGGEVRVQSQHGEYRKSDTIPPAKDPFPPRG